MYVMSNINLDRYSIHRRWQAVNVDWVLKNSKVLWLVMIWILYPISLSYHFINALRIAKASNSQTAQFCCTVVNFLDMNPAGLQFFHVSPWPYIAPTPDFDASHMSHMGSVIFGSIGRMTGALSHMCLIISKHLWCKGHQWNGAPFWVITRSGLVYDVISGRKFPI